MVSKIFSFIVFMISIQNVNHTVYKFKMKNNDTKIDILHGRIPHFFNIPFFVLMNPLSYQNSFQFKKKHEIHCFPENNHFVEEEKSLVQRNNQFFLFFQILILDFISKSENNWHKEIHFQVYHEKASLSETIRRKNEKKNHSF